MSIAPLSSCASGTAASGTVGLAIKGAMAAYDRMIADGDLRNEHILLGILDDAVRFAPELAPFAGELMAAGDHAEGDQAESEDTGSTDKRTTEIRARVEALVAEYAGPLPAGDAGLIEAERRQQELSAGWTALSREFKVNAKEEETCLEPVIAAETEMWHVVGDRMPQTLAGIAVKLRWVRTQEGDPEVGAAVALGQCLDAIERMNNCRRTR